MEKLLLDLEMEIANGQKEAKNANELYQLLSSYNAYNILLFNAKLEYESKTDSDKQRYLDSDYYPDSDCYKKKTDDLFSLFKTDEYLSGKIVSETSREDMIFLIDQNTLLRIYSFDIANSPIGGLSRIDYNLIKIHECLGKIYKEYVYHRDPLFCDSHYENENAFGLFCDKNLITPAFVLDSQFKTYDNMDIREILKVQSIDEIHEKIREAKKIKTKKLI